MSAFFLCSYAGEEQGRQSYADEEQDSAAGGWGGSATVRQVAGAAVRQDGSRQGRRRTPTRSRPGRFLSFWLPAFWRSGGWWLEFVRDALREVEVREKLGFLVIE